MLIKNSSYCNLRGESSRDITVTIINNKSKEKTAGGFLSLNFNLITPNTHKAPTVKSNSVPAPLFPIGSLIN